MMHWIASMNVCICTNCWTHWFLIILHPAHWLNAFVSINLYIVIYFRLLNCIAHLVNGTEREELTSLLEACRIRPPMPGHTLKVTYNAGQSVFSCQCPDNKLPCIPENVGTFSSFFLISQYWLLIQTSIIIVTYF